MHKQNAFDVSSVVLTRLIFASHTPAFDMGILHVHFIANEMKIKGKLSLRLMCLQYI